MSDTELTPMLEGEQVRRIEVFTGAGRRRRWPAEVKARIVAESYGGGESVSAVARRHGLTAQQLFTWRRLGRGRAARPDEEAVGFAPVVVETPAGAVSAWREEPRRVAAVIEIAVAGAVVRVPPGIDPRALTAVLRAVKATAS